MNISVRVEKVETIAELRQRFNDTGDITAYSPTWTPTCSAPDVAKHPADLNVIYDCGHGEPVCFTHFRKRVTGSGSVNDNTSASTKRLLEALG